MFELLGQAPVWLIATSIYVCWLVIALIVFYAVFKLGKAWHVEVSPGFFTPNAVVFGLIVGFLASQIWSDNNRAISTVMREASTLKSIVAVSEVFPDQTKNEILQLARDYVDNAVQKEWPAMQEVRSYKGLSDTADKLYLPYILSLKPSNENEASAKQQLLASFKALHEAKDERLLLSGTSVNPLKWSVVIALAFILLIVTSLVHRNNPKSALLALLIYSTVISLCFILIFTHDRPFTGYISISPELLINARP